jgi:hypothetical protein
MMYGSDLGSIVPSYVIFTNFGRRNMAAGNFGNSAYCFLCSNQLLDDFLLLDKWSMVNDVPNKIDDFVSLNSLSNWLCELWSPHGTWYSIVIVSPRTNLLFSFRGSIIMGHIHLLFYCKSASTSVTEYSSIAYVILVYALLVVTLHIILYF